MVSDSLESRNFYYEQNFKIRKTSLKHFRHDIKWKNPLFVWPQDDTNRYYIEDNVYERKLRLLKNYEKMLQRRRKEEYVTQFAIICCVFIGLFFVLYFTL